MSSPSDAAGATLSDPDARAAALRSAGDDDNGEPVVDLPPLIEPKLDPFASRPPRRSFLAPAAEQTPVALKEQVAPTPATPEPIEPAPAAKRDAVSLFAKREWWIVVAIVCVAIVALVIIAYSRHFGPFAGARQYPVAAAPTDPAQRVAYFQQGAAAGDGNAELQLAIIYAKGDGVAQDYAASANWFRAAADHGVPRAQYDLGVMYERGRGVKTDLTEAANWYLKSAQGGYPLAQYNIGVCYTKGQGVRQDLAEAALWYRRAATQGVIQAMSNLAVMYDKGDGVGASTVDAYAWYRAAGRRGDQNSEHRAEYLYDHMEQLDQLRAEALASDVGNSIHDFPADGGDAVPAAPATAQH
jgi:TPR repeat protein